MQQEITDYNFSVGDVVVDIDDSDTNNMIIVDDNVGEARNFVLDDNTTVAENNPDYPDDDTVVEVVYESRIRSFLNNWSGDNFKSNFQEFENKWNVKFSRYYFPISRLKSLE